ncbi:hypothetical protein ACWKWV_09645 [Castellaniella ginsengisoli]
MPTPHTALVTHTLDNAHVPEWLKAQAADGYALHAYGVDVADEASCPDMNDGQHRVRGTHDRHAH